MSTRDARISEHARQRCAEMGISTKVAKRIARNPSIVLPDFGGIETRRFVYSTDEPQYAIVIAEIENDRPLVVTVLHYSQNYTPRRNPNAV